MKKTKKNNINLKDFQQFIPFDIKYIFIVMFILPFVTLYLAIFQVNEVQTVFVIEFGKIIKNVEKAGLHFKIPFIQDVVRFDKRILQVDLSEKEVIASDQKRLIIDAYAKYKITDAKKFYETFNHEGIAISKINSILDSSLRQIVAKRPLLSLLSEQRKKIMSEIQEIVTSQTKDFGINIIDVRIIKTELPIENSDAIFSRMKTSREKEAKELRAEGDEQATILKAEADKQVEIIKSVAQKNANSIKGLADAEVIKIYSNSFTKDPDFFNFYRSMESYRNVINGQNITINAKENKFFEKF